MATDIPEYTDKQMAELLDIALEIFDEEIYFRVVIADNNPGLPGAQFVLPLLTTMKLARSALAAKEEPIRMH